MIVLIEVFHKIQNFEYFHISCKAEMLNEYLECMFWKVAPSNLLDRVGFFSKLLLITRKLRNNHIPLKSSMLI